MFCRLARAHMRCSGGFGQPCKAVVSFGEAYAFGTTRRTPIEPHTGTRTGFHCYGCRHTRPIGRGCAASKVCACRLARTLPILSIPSRRIGSMSPEMALKVCGAVLVNRLCCISRTLNRYQNPELDSSLWSCFSMTLRFGNIWRNGTLRCCLVRSGGLKGDIT